MQTGPLCLLWSHCIDREIVIFPWLLLLKHRNIHLQRGWNTSPKQDLTWPGVVFGPAWQFPSHQMGCAAALSGDEYMAWHPSDAKILPCPWLAQRHHVLLTATRSAQGPIGPDLALMDNTHVNVCQKKSEKSIYSMGFGWRLLLRSKGLKFGSWCKIRETKSFNDWAFCTSLLAPDHPRGQRAGIKPAACCPGSLIRGAALCTDKSREPRFCCCFGCWSARRACETPQLQSTTESLTLTSIVFNTENQDQLQEYCTKTLGKHESC